MSVSIILIPVAMAAVAAWRASRPEEDGQGQSVCHVSTRMRNEDLLCAALEDMGATVDRTGQAITADWEQLHAEFTRDEDGIWSVHLRGDVDTPRAEQFVATLDANYGKRVQQEVLARIRERAPVAGMTLESESVEDDDSVIVVLNVGAEAR